LNRWSELNRLNPLNEILRPQKGFWGENRTLGWTGPIAGRGGRSYVRREESFGKGYINFMNAKSIGKILKCTVSEFGEDNVLRLSAALAYYAMFSLGPLLVIAVGLAGLAFGHDAVRGQLQEQLRGM